jgi:hypothetical protein
VTDAPSLLQSVERVSLPQIQSNLRNFPVLFSNAVGLKSVKSVKSVVEQISICGRLKILSLSGEQGLSAE